MNARDTMAKAPIEGIRTNPDGYYDAIARGYDALHGEEQDRKYRIILRELPISREDSVLDVGCGTGRFLSLLPAQAQGIDPSEKLIAQAPPHCKARMLQADAAKLPFPDRRFDVVVSVTALQNMEDPARAITEMKRVGKRRFAITYLRRSPKASLLRCLLEAAFPKATFIEEDKDSIMISDDG